MPTTSYLEAAAALLEELWEVGARHGVDLVEADLAPRVTDSLTSSYRRPTAEDVDLVGLLTKAATVAATEVGQNLTDLVVEDAVQITPERGYVVLARLPQSPAWGRTGTAPLVVCLGREDRGSLPAAWEWTLVPDQPGGSYLLSTVLAPPPTLEVAAEVGQIAARALTGKL